MSSRRYSSSRRAVSSRGGGYDTYERERRQRLKWCQENGSVEEDVKRYWGKAKEGFQAVSDWWNGSGDYEIVSNSLIRGGTKAAMQPLVVSNQRNGGEVRIRFREYLGDVKTHPTVVGAWYNTAYTLNAGNALTFPWLSAIALNYEQWTPNGIIFEFRSTATEYSTSVNLGSIIMATEYDYSDADYSSKMEALNSAYAMESKTSTEVQMHGVECAPSANPNRIFWVNAGTVVPAGTSKNEYFLGKFQIATVGSSGAANSVVGSLYINYDITLRKPQYIQGLLGKQILFDYFSLVAPINETFPLGSATPTRSVDSNLGCTVALNTLTFPDYVNAGVWKVTWGGRSVAPGANGFHYGPSAALTNCTEIAPVDGSPTWLTWKVAKFAQLAGQTSDFSGSMYVQVTGSGAKIVFGQNTSPASTFSFSIALLSIEQMNSSEA